HISKLGRGRRVERVEDVVALGDDLEVVVEDIDPNGKISLKLTGDDSSDERDSGSRSDDRGGRDRDDRRGRRYQRPDYRGERGHPRYNRLSDVRGSRYRYQRGARGSRDDRRGRDDRRDRGDRRSSDRGGRDRGDWEGPSQAASFEDDFEAQLRDEFGDLGPSGGSHRRGGGRGRDRDRAPR
ncbi:MAG: polyribonucleotide nucleotidyltransferase, partial [bacterium]|nr:polyribonucleotide nucleotidyltransferase [bacterium]